MLSISILLTLNLETGTISFHECCCMKTEFFKTNLSCLIVFMENVHLDPGKTGDLTVLDIRSTLVIVQF